MRAIISREVREVVRTGGEIGCAFYMIARGPCIAAHTWVVTRMSVVEQVHTPVLIEPTVDVL
jgi:hypothetical protein